MAGRFSLLLTMGLAMLFACAGVALAQPTESDPGQAKEEDPVAPASSPDAGEVIPNHYIVVLDEDAAPAAVASDLAEEVDLETTHIYDDALDGFAAEIPPGSVSEVRSDPRVEFVAKDRVLEASEQKRPKGIRRVDAEKSSTEAGNGSGRVNADIAILDTGIYKQHRDLNIAGGYNCVGEDKTAWSDGDGHGTHVAGTAAAKDNSVGVVGVAPRARLWAVRVLNNSGTGRFSWAMCGLDWITGKDADGDGTSDIEVANMSLGATVAGSDDGNCGWNGDLGPDGPAAMHLAICHSVGAGVFYTVAAGNDRKDFAKSSCDGGHSCADVPAAFDQVLTVTAMADFNGKPGGGASSTCRRDVDDTFANFSNRTTAGSPDANHTIAAPGVCIRSTWNNGGYKSMAGTSMASPHVAGAAALCIATSATTGQCTGGPTDVMNTLRSDGAAQPASYGFFGDPNDPFGSTRYYGYLVYAGGY